MWQMRNGANERSCFYTAVATIPFFKPITFRNICNVWNTSSWLQSCGNSLIMPPKKMAPRSRSLATDLQFRGSVSYFSPSMSFNSIPMIKMGSISKAFIPNAVPAPRPASSWTPFSLTYVSPFLRLNGNKCGGVERGGLQAPPSG